MIQKRGKSDCTRPHCGSMWRETVTIVLVMFCAKLSQETMEDLELRICADQESTDEDIQIEAINIYAH